MADEVLYEEVDGIAIVAINRPEKKNALTENVVPASRRGSTRRPARRRWPPWCCAAWGIRSPPATT